MSEAEVREQCPFCRGVCICTRCAAKDKQVGPEVIFLWLLSSTPEYIHTSAIQHDLKFLKFVSVPCLESIALCCDDVGCVQFD
jgi:hypothetical protein